MSAPHADPLIEGYLARLRAAAVDLTPGARDELTGDVRAHIAEARSRETEETDATILNILDRLGEPDELVSEARQRPNPSTPGRQSAAPGPYRPGAMEIAAVVLLPFVWPVGVILLWLSPAWRVRDKIIGSLLPPGGYPGFFFVLFFARLVFGFTITWNSGADPSAGQIIGRIAAALFIFGFYVLPIATAGYLAIRLRWGRQPRRSAVAAV